MSKMKRKSGTGDIVDLFGKYEAKKFPSCEAPLVVVDVQAEGTLGMTPGSGNLLQFSDSPPPVDTDSEIETEIHATTTSSPHLPSGGSDDTHIPFECDPGKRIPISSHDVNDQDDVRRRYIAKGPFRSYAHNFPIRKMYGKSRHFSCVWFEHYHWLEYSVSKDSGFCFVCYLFKARVNGGPGGDTFVNGGWRNFHKPSGLLKHVGGVSSIHNQAQEKYNLFVTPNTSIDNIIVKVSKEDLRLYLSRLTYSLRCLRFLLLQGLACRGHDKSEESDNKGNFLE